jgi:hypothetical protein
MEQEAEITAMVALKHYFEDQKNHTLVELNYFYPLLK